MLSTFGSIENPLNKINPNGYGSLVSTSPDLGLLGFISNIFRFLTIVAGIWALFNFIFAGFQFVTSQGEPKQLEDARNKIFMSIIGLVIIVGSFAFFAILSKILFGNYYTILNPTLYGPGSI